jgi:membrane complex biogenesis BtpA family protein
VGQFEFLTYCVTIQKNQTGPLPVYLKIRRRVAKYFGISCISPHDENKIRPLAERHPDTPSGTIALPHGYDSMDSNGVINSLFGVPRALIGVIHLGALPGTPSNRKSVAEIADEAVREARVYEEAGFHGLAIENTHDRPYLKSSVGPEIGAAMAVVGSEVRRGVSLPLGIQVLAGANLWAVAIAHACVASFVRVEGFVFAHVADEGLIESSAGALLRYRRAIGADNVRIFADIKKKHSAHAITADVDIVETAKAAEFFQADGVIVSGISTGRPADASEVEAVSRAVSIPTLIGSGITPENIGRYSSAAAFIVGSSVKQDGLWANPLEERRVLAVVRAFEELPAA